MKCSNPACGWISDSPCTFCQNCAAPMDDPAAQTRVVLCPGKLDNNYLCQAVLRETQKFCQECGTKVNAKLFIKQLPILLCRGKLHDNSVCGAVMTPSQKFCHECGTKVDHRRSGGTDRCSKCENVLELGTSVCSMCDAESTIQSAQSREERNSVTKSRTAKTKASTNKTKASKIKSKPSTAITKPSRDVSKPSRALKKTKTVSKTNRTVVKPSNVGCKSSRNKATPVGSTKHTAGGKENTAVLSTDNTDGHAHNSDQALSAKNKRSVFESMELDTQSPEKDVIRASVHTEIADTGSSSTPVGKSTPTKLKQASIKAEKIDPKVMLYCYPCALAFTSEYHFDRHTKYRHSKYPRIEVDDQSPGDKSVSETTETRKSTDVPDPSTPKEEQKEEVVKKKRVYKPKPTTTFECEICGKTLKQLVTFNAHMNTHRGVHPHACTQCDARFADPSRLSKHRKQHSGRKKEFACKHCDKTFFEQSGLRLHILSHTQERKFVCEFCDKRFLQRPHLMKHVSHIHTKERKHNCTICGKSFYDKYRLNAHKKIHDNIRAYKCSVCDLAFHDGSNLRAHLRVHSGETPYCCVTCNKKFARSMDLKSHMSVHGEAKYKCSLCGHQCRTELGIKSHVLQHKNIKPYGCEYCDRRYMHNSNVQAHMKKHHAAEIKAEQEPYVANEILE